MWADRLFLEYQTQYLGLRLSITTGKVRDSLFGFRPISSRLQPFCHLAAFGPRQCNDLCNRSPPQALHDSRNRATAAVQRQERSRQQHYEASDQTPRNGAFQISAKGPEIHAQVQNNTNDQGPTQPFMGGFVQPYIQMEEHQNAGHGTQDESTDCQRRGNLA